MGVYFSAVAPLAQRLEQRPFKSWVVGSNPTGGTDGPRDHTGHGDFCFTWNRRWERHRTAHAHDGQSAHNMQSDDGLPTGRSQGLTIRRHTRAAFPDARLPQHMPAPHTSEPRTCAAHRNRTREHIFLPHPYLSACQGPACRCRHCPCRYHTRHRFLARRRQTNIRKEKARRSAGLERGKEKKRDFQLLRPFRRP